MGYGKDMCFDICLDKQGVNVVFRSLLFKTMLEKVKIICWFLIWYSFLEIVFLFVSFGDEGFVGLMGCVR